MKRGKNSKNKKSTSAATTTKSPANKKKNKNKTGTKTKSGGKSNGKNSTTPRLGKNAKNRLAVSLTAMDTGDGSKKTLV